MKYGITACLLYLALDICMGCTTPVKQGCFKHDGKNDYLIFSDKTEHKSEKFHSGVDIDWSNFEKYLKDALCRCEKAAAEKGMKYFSFRYFGICHGLNSLPSAPSEYCFHHSFEQCMKHHDQCVGADEAEYIYKVGVKIPINTIPALKVRRNIFCEHRGSRTISCGQNEKIKITKAYYGRTSKNHCGYKSFFNLKCKGSTSGRKIESACNGKQSCRLNPHNSVYGDPCKYTVKYIDVEYVCLPQVKKAVFCEHRGVRDISCGNGQKIEILNGYYGRQSSGYCGYKHFYNLRCKSSRSLTQIPSACNGKQSCRLNPHNGVYGDPCPYTVKYIEVDYRCVSS